MMSGEGAGESSLKIQHLLTLASAVPEEIFAEMAHASRKSTRAKAFNALVLERCRSSTRS